MSGEKEKPQGRRGKNRNSMDRGKSRQTSQSRKTGGPAGQASSDDGRSWADRAGAS